MLRAFSHTYQPKWIFFLRHLVLYYSAPLLLIFIPFFLILGLYYLTLKRSAPELQYTSTQIQEHQFNPDAVFWFVQISDTHFSNTQAEIYKDFDLFLKTRINSGILPEFVVHSGDITDAFERGIQTYPFFVSKQYIEQWIRYKAILVDNDLWDPSVWIDLRGNHDCYSVPSVDHPLNYFNEYSTVSRRWGPQRFEWSYSFVYNSNFGKYSVVFFDACPELGANFPLNFFGTSHEASEAALQEELNKAVDSNVTFFVSHYPINDMRLSTDFRDLVTVKNEEIQGEKKLIPTVALNGHLHAVDTYRRVDERLLELEVADFKDKRFYRLISVDNDLFSFKDVQFNRGDFPLIHITLPKRSDVLSSKEKWEVMRHVDRVRALVFSETSVDGDNLRVYIDDQIVAFSMDRVELKNRRFNSSAHNGGLFSAEYNRTQYTSGVHVLRVELMEGEEVVSRDRIEFSLDGTTTTIGPWIGFLTLEVTDYLVCRAIVAFFYVYAVLILLLLPKLFILSLTFAGLYPKFHSYMDGYLARATELIPNEIRPMGALHSNKKGSPNIAAGCLYIFSDLVHSIGFHIMQYGRMTFFLWFIHMLFAVYFLLGPIVVGAVVDKIQGFLFFAGVAVNNEFSFLPETTCYFGFIIFVLIWMPSIMVSSIPYNTRVECDKIQRKIGYFENEGFFLHLLRTLYRFTLIGFLASLCSFVFSVMLTVFFSWQYGYGVLTSISAFWFMFFTLLNSGISFWRVWKLPPSKMKVKR
mmetsp:Transcript_9633/g.35714  ORF Transcript_9633/g.35714 Transcript_9633/m.35714 type:complete len:750 (+) Transcript_9633:95-2344(+)